VIEVKKGDFKGGGAEEVAKRKRVTEEKKWR
jgi:hypothetical protein